MVPGVECEFTGDRVSLAYDKVTVKNAPTIAEDGHLSPQDQAQLGGSYDSTTQEEPA